ncbi:hypothetical protein VTK56DRAFT_490 [Thermocarpiscus australiensis]
MLERRASRRRRIWSAVTSIRSMLDTVLLLVILGLLLERQWHRLPQFEIAGDITGFAPRVFSQQIVRFAPDPTFVPENMSDFFTEAVQPKWWSMAPKGFGFVRVNNTKDYNNLPTPLEWYPDSTFTTSVTHQIHCLRSILQAVAAYSSGQLDKVPSDGVEHLGHCFDYLRQGIMCCGDIALEGQGTTFPPRVLGSDGWDAKHVCRDYSQIMSYLEEKRVEDGATI